MRALASTSEIGLQSRCPCVENRDGIGVVSPHVAEGNLQLWNRELLKWRAGGLRNDTEFEKLFMCNFSAEYALDDVGSVKAVHTVSTHDTFLTL